MNGHQNMKQMGRNNHLQTLFHTHSYILYNRKRVIKILSPPNTLQKTLSQEFEWVRESKLKNSMNGHLNELFSGHIHL